MPGENGKGGSGSGGTDDKGQGSGNSGQIVIELNGEQKTLTSDEIKGLVGKATEADKLSQQFAPFSKVLTQYGVSPEDYLRNSEGSFALVNQLIEAGVIDDQGNILKKDSGAPNVPEKKSVNVDLTKSGGEKGLEVVLKALKGLGDRLEQLEDGQSGIYRRNIENDVKGKHPNLETEDITRLLAKAKADKSKSFWDHAEALSKEKEVVGKRSELESAKRTVELLQKAGIIPAGAIDLSKLDLDALKTQGSETAPKIWEGKKFVFDSRRKKLKGAGVDTSGFANPSDAMAETMKKRFA